jgi:hypothetical protein
VCGELRERLALAFPKLAVQPCDGRTTIVCEITDQQHLHRILDRMRNLGIELISLTQID